MSEASPKGQGVGHGDYCRVIGQVTLDLYHQIGVLRKSLDEANAFIRSVGGENGELRAELTALRAENAAHRSRQAVEP